MEITKINRSEKKIKLENLKNYLLISLWYMRIRTRIL